MTAPHPNPSPQGEGQERLFQAARDAATRAYAPYSRFHVGAALLMADGSIVTGANVENASYGLSLCAETVALAKAANDGGLADVVEIAVVGGDGAEPCRPCGRCRQIINEAAQLGKRDILIHCLAGGSDAHEAHLLSTLLPHAFGPADLGIG